MARPFFAAALCLMITAGSATGAELLAPSELLKLVHQDCGSCHGMSLKGGLGPDIRPQILAHFDVETLSAIVLDGIPGTAMPPWRPLISEADAKRIAEYLLKGEIK
ncbi:c-type cytochrome [Roseibium sediminis]|uniref:c-type cytochrome n=1 Tax=Roseibium sediminis TaxID=1775174 RepID=UPI00123E306C|nr:cytochrome c [Roseibium sediminis]